MKTNLDCGSAEELAARLQELAAQAEQLIDRSRDKIEHVARRRAKQLDERPGSRSARRCS